MMEKQAQIDQIHEGLNDIYMDLHDISVIDEKSREAKQKALVTLIRMRKIMDANGMAHRQLDRSAA